MGQTVKLLRILGSPLAPSALEPVPEGEIPSLYALAAKNKIGFFFLEALKRQGKLGELEPEYEKGYTRYSETLVTAAKISKVIDSMGIEHVIFKFIKPYPSTPSDVDVLFLCSDHEYKQAVQMLLAKDYYKIGETPSQVVVYDLRGGYEAMDTRTWGGKGGGIYYIDLYKEVGASHLVYMDKEKLSKYVTEVNLNGEKIKTLKPQAELAVAVAHSMIPEQLYTLADYYVTLYYLAEASEESLSSFIDIVKENHIVLPAKSAIKITSLLHQAAHGFIPERMQEVLIRLNAKDLKRGGSLFRGDFETPYRYSISTLGRAIGEKMREGKFRKSIMVQVAAMLNPMFAKRIIDGFVWRRKRETY